MAKRKKKVSRKPARKKTRKVARARRAPARRKKALTRIEEALEVPNRAAALLWGEPRPLEQPAGTKKD
ncbi:MAG TPA: hypothetical protein VLW88_12675 [Hyphomicrobium sp.]|nr:hypothetical protein [Hyphomicrobium sp.]